MSLKGGLRRRHAMAYLGLTGIGLGSFGFHSTLKWEWQLLDELPMVRPPHLALVVWDGAERITGAS